MPTEQTKLNPRQAQFVKEYLTDLNATQAAIRAGYSVKTAVVIGAQNLTKLNIATAIQLEMDKRSKRVEINADYVLKTIVETIERCKQAEPVMTRNDGGEMVESGEYRFDPASVLKGSELLGKHLKMFTDKVEVNGIIEHHGHDSLAAELARAIATAQAQHHRGES